MIEKNSEVMPVLAISNENTSDDSRFLDGLDKEKKERQYTHGEDVMATIVRLFPELYHKKMTSDGELKPGVIKNHKVEQQSLSVSEMLSNVQKRQATLVVQSGVNEIKEIKGGDITSSTATQSANLREAAVAIPVSTLTGKLTHKGDDETKEQSVETSKAHTTAAQIKNDGMSARLELLSQEMKPRTPQLSIPDRLLQANASTLTESAVSQKQSLSLDYPFLRWSGEHSVKVSIPVEVSRTANLTMLPSDTRAAEILSRQMGQLSGYTTELLHPQQDEDESERRQAQPAWEEEQE